MRHAATRLPVTRAAASRRAWCTVVVSALAWGLWAGPVRAQPPAPKAEEVKIGQTLRDATMRGLNGPPRRLSEFRGRPLVINVWASWCGPCRQEMASLERLAWAETSVPFAIIGISTDDYPERAMQVLKATNATISHFVDRNLELESMLGASSIPLTVLVDANGRVIDKIYGARQWDSPDSRSRIRNAFKLQAAAPRS
jgi:thiol-disulfide isomerase/thioredoxin